ncbi:MAG: carboxylate-amine ligase [Pseudomonadota bacterium]
MSAPLRAFAAYGIELEYMLVDAVSLDVAPIADQLLAQEAGAGACDVARGDAGWSNELVLHLVELKNRQPQPDLGALHALFRDEVRHLNRRLAAFGARLMPTGMHPWMDPRRETRLWPHAGADVYRSFDRIFDCRRHGWANLQSMHVNLPFADDAEFARLHAAVRLVLPLLPALAASSPIVEGRITGVLDSRLEAYRGNCARLPSITGAVIPECAHSRADYETKILAPMYRDMTALDPAGELRHEWLNARGAIARFERNAIEIRVLDTQECPQADVAIAAATVAAVRRLYQRHDMGALQAPDTGELARIFLACVRDAERAVIDDRRYLALWGFPGARSEARELWHLLTESDGALAPWRAPLAAIWEQGTLARRIVRAVGADHRREQLRQVYGELCACLEQDRLFLL